MNSKPDPCWLANTLTTFAVQGGVNTHVYTEQSIQAWCTELTHIKPLSDPSSQLHGAPKFPSAMNILFDFLKNLRETHNNVPIVLCGHNLAHFDFVALYCQCRRECIDMFARLRDCGATLVSDTLHIARAIAWPKPPIHPDTQLPSFKLGALHFSLGFGLLTGAHDACVDVQGNQSIACHKIMLEHSMQKLSVYSIAACVQRARVMRHIWAAQPSITKMQSEIRLQVQHFAHNAKVGSRLSMQLEPTALRWAAHNEANKLGVTSTSVGEGSLRSVVLIQSPPSPTQPS